MSAFAGEPCVQWGEGMARQWGLLLALALGGLVSGRGLAAAPRLALRVPPCEARRTQRGMRDCAALPLRGGGGEEVAAEREDVKNVEPWDMEQSPKIAAILADPDKRDLAYNATVMEFHRERDRCGDELSEERMQHYFWSHMLLRHPDVDAHFYNETHYAEFLDSFFAIDDDDGAYDPAALEAAWSAEQSRGRVGALENASMEEMVRMSARAVEESRRPLLHVPRDFTTLDLALPELEDGGTLLVARGDFVVSAAAGDAGAAAGEAGLPAGQPGYVARDEAELQEGSGYVVEQGRRGLLVSGSFVQHSAAGGGPGKGQDDEGATDGEGREMLDEERVHEVGPVSQVGTRVWGRWQLGDRSDGLVRYIDCLLQSPPAAAISTNHTRHALMSVAGRWEFERCSLRCSLSVAVTAVWNATLTLSQCAVGGLGDAADTELGRQYAGLRDVDHRHAAAVSKARTLHADAAAWHEEKKWDRELEAQLAELQDPEFLISTATGALDEAEALLSNCSNELSTRVGLLDTFEDPHNQEHWQQIEREARSPDSLLWIEVSARCEEGVLLFDDASLVMSKTNITLADVIEGSALRVADRATVCATACTIRQVGFAVTLHEAAAVELDAVVIAACSRHPLQAVAGCQAASLRLTGCHITCAYGRRGLWRQDLRPGTFAIEHGGNVFEEEKDDVLARLLRGDLSAVPDEDIYDAPFGATVDELDGKNKRDLEARLATIDVKQKLDLDDDVTSNVPVGRRILFANDDMAPF